MGFETYTANLRFPGEEIPRGMFGPQLAKTRHPKDSNEHTQSYMFVIHSQLIVEHTFEILNIYKKSSSGQI